MPNALDISFLPPAVAPQAVPVEATPGRLIIVTAAEDADASWASSFRQLVLFERHPTSTSRTRRAEWRGLSRSPRALRARKGYESGCWVPLISEAESKLREELVSYTHLDDNWDGDGAKAPSQQAVNNALTFLANRPADVPLPYPEEGTEGDVGVYWDNSSAHVFAEVIFEGDGTCAYFAVHGVPGSVTEKCGNDGVDVAAPWPDDMLRILRIQDPI